MLYYTLQTQTVLRPAVLYVSEGQIAVLSKMFRDRTPLRFAEDKSSRRTFWDSD